MVLRLVEKLIVCSQCNTGLGEVDSTSETLFQGKPVMKVTLVLL